MRAVSIYVLIDAEGQRRYVGKSVDPTRRFKSHRRGKAWAKLFVVLEQCDEAVWQDRERFWIRHGRSDGWPLENLADGGSGPPPYFVVPLGRTPWNKGKPGSQVPWNKGLRGAQIAWNKGKKLTAEQRKNTGSATRRGRPLSESHRRNIAAGNRGKRHRLFGPLSQQHRQKIADSLRGRVRSPEHCARLAEALRGHPISLETRAKISATLLAKTKEISCE